MILQSFRRYERKYLLNRAQLEALLPVLKAHMDFDAFCPDGKTYEITDLYFDTPGHEIVRGCALETGFKEKLRLRFYSPFFNADTPCFLEYKKKLGKLGGKRRAPVTAGEAEDFLCRGIVPRTQDPVTREIFTEIQHFISGRLLQPAARVHYRRLALFGRDCPELRATIDCALCAEILSPNPSEILRIPLLEEGGYLLEIKVPGAMPLWLSPVLSQLHLFSQSHSKYGRAWQLARLRQLRQA